MEQFQGNQDPETQRTELQPRRTGGMNRRAIILTVALFLFIIAGMFIFAFLQRDESTEPVDSADATEDESPYAHIDRIEATHFYIDGVHTVAGEIAMPTPCDLLESSATVAESMPEQITLEFNVVNNAEFCAQQITPQRFKVSATASEDATFSATFEGRPVELNLIEAPEGETPEDFELFIKG